MVVQRIKMIAIMRKITPGYGYKHKAGGGIVLKERNGLGIFYMNYSATFWKQKDYRDVSD